MFLTIKSALATCLTLLWLLVSSSHIVAEEMKIASLDMKKVFSSWSFAVEEELKLKEARIAFEKENSERVAVIKDYEERRRNLYQTDGEEIEPEEKVKLDSEFIKLGREVYALKQDRVHFYAKGKNELDRETAAQAKLVLEVISEVVQVYALAEKYDMIVEQGGHTSSHMPLFLYLDEAKDITDIIIKRLDDSSNE